MSWERARALWQQGRQLMARADDRRLPTAIAESAAGSGSAEGHPPGGGESQNGGDSASGAFGEGWDFYFSHIGEDPASISLDLTLRDRAPLRGRPYHFWVWVDLRVRRDDGLSHSSEAEILWKIEETLQTILAGRLDARYVGRVTAGGQRGFFFYAPSGTKPETVVRGVLARFPEYSYRFGGQDDPEWRGFFDLLCPDEREEDWTRSRDVVDRLKEQGDLLHTPREIDYYIYLPTKESCDAFVRRVRAARFSVHDVVSLDGAQEPSRFLVRICRVGPADLNSVYAVELELMDWAEQVGGKYDGWETCVVTEAGGRVAS